MIAGLQIALTESNSPQTIAAPKRFVNVNQKVISTKSIAPRGQPVLSVIGGGSVEVSIGSSVAQAGQGTCVPVTLLTSAGLTNLSFSLVCPAGFLKNWTVNSTNSAIGSATVGKANTSEPQFVFGIQSGQVRQGSSVIGSICLDTVAGASAFVPLIVTNLSAMGADNSAATNLLTQNGRVAVIGPQPLLDATLDTDLNPMLTLYGQPGVSYKLLSRTNLIGGGLWSTAGNFTLSGLFQGISLVGASNQMQFFRAVQP
jgi:hypothetical protein